ncbi:MAG: VOC family protein [Acidimicrobiia bacterium]|nr:VOC family protein [Acidimicrobiia bacterium]
MDLIRHVVVFDAADVATESAFWAEMLGGSVVDEDPQFHCVIDSQGNWLVGVQHAPDHVPPDWPDGEPQQVHIDFHVTDPAAAHRRAIDLGSRLLQDATDPDADHGYRVYADPAGHPFCLGWGHPNHEQLAQFLSTYGEAD